MGVAVLGVPSGFSRIARGQRCCKDSWIADLSTVQHDTPDEDEPQLGGRARRAQRPLARTIDDAVLGGVCAGVARRLGLSTRTVRFLFVFALLVGAAGLFFYMACWALVPRDGEPQSAASRVVADRRQLQVVVAATTVAFAVLVALWSLGLHGPPGAFAWPLLLSAVGALCVWRGVSDDERAHLQERFDSAPLVSSAASTGWRTIVLRACLGGSLVLIGVVLLSEIGQLRGAAIGVFIGIVALCSGFFVLFAPWWLRTLRDLSHERRQRVRAQERADVAAHLHDSVLQTLLLIQKAAERPTEVVRLARNQERELRHWLFDPTSHAQRRGATFATAAEEIEREVEEAYGIGVELVVVGDDAIDEAMLALLAAAREGAINAAKWSGTPSISMYGEIEPDKVSFFVRDLGIGFELSAVPPDRKGIACSIVERMARHGGTAVIRSAVGVGTEVELVLPRTRAPVMAS